MGAEFSRLQNIAKVSTYSAGVMDAAIKHFFKIVKRFSIGQPKILEIGPAEGVMTDLLAKDFENITVVEGAELFCNEISKRHPSIKVFNSLIEDYRSEEKYDVIILGHVLEHVEDPISVLNHIKSFLTPTGVIICSVPNARSIHRQAAVEMRMLPFEESLNETDIKHGHRRVYNPESLRKEFYQAGMQISAFGGYWMKPLSNSQIESTWNEKMINAFMSLGERYPDIAAEIYVVAGL